MEASELRIGNWVFNKAHERKQLTEIYADCSVYDPIPLTDEWLERFGFDVEYTNGGWLRWQKGNFKLLDRRLPHPQYHNPEASIEYVHQLQNLYFALTGQELEIKENA